MYIESIYIPHGSELLIDSHHGRYIPQIFAQQFRSYATSASSAEITDEDWNILLAGPYHEHYWDVWSDVLDNCIIKWDTGKEFSLVQNEDVWAIPVPSEPADLTIFNRTAHQELWFWLAEHPSYSKSDWPGWQYYNGGSDNCFACVAAENLHDGSLSLCICSFCPLKWPKGKYCHEGLYRIWYNTDDARVRRNIATRIANLPVKDGYKYV